MPLKSVSKAIAGAAAGAIGGSATIMIAVPDTVTMPWWGYVGVGLANAVLGYLAVYWAPRNAT